MSETEKEMACSNISYEITEQDLPLCCPQNDKLLWNAHPKVYLPVEESGEETCPYCGTVYILKRLK